MKNRLFIVAMIVSYCPNLAAQEILVEYTAELQYDLKQRTNFVSLLNIGVDLSTERLGLWENGELSYASKSIFKTSEDRIADDFQVFSNIEEANRPYALVVLGYTQTFSNVKLFAGVRSANEDYFTAPYTSLFTNSSCGIYPTISANYPLANYPLAGMCFHAEFLWKENWQLKNSLYNGIAYESFGKGSSVFAFRPRKDGIFNMTELSYIQKSNYNGRYSGGIALHSGMYFDHESGEQAKEKSQKKEMNYTWWASVEQAIYRDGSKQIGLLVQYSMAPPRKNECSRYAGMGVLFTGFLLKSGQDQIGIFMNQGTFSSSRERTAEVTCKIPLTKNLCVQPSFHLIKNGVDVYTVGMLRATILLFQVAISPRKIK